MTSSSTLRRLKWLNAQSSVSRVASVPRPSPRRSPRKIPKRARPWWWSTSHEPARAERLAVAAGVDRQRRRPRVVLRVASERLVDPRLLGLRLQDAEVGEADAHVAAVQPARVRRGEVAPKRPERDALALDQVVDVRHRYAPLG